MNRIVSPLRKVDYPERNVFINGAFDFFQPMYAYGGAAVTTNGKYTADRWKTNLSHSASFSVTSDSDVPSNLSYTLNRSMKFEVTTGASTGAAEYAGMVYGFEGNDFNKLVGKYVTISFWYKSNVSGIHTAMFANSSQNYRYTFEFTIFQANTWEKKEHTLLIDGSIPFGSGTLTDLYGYFYFLPSVGSDYHGDVNQWVSNTNFGSSSAIDLMATTSNYFKVTGLMLVEGDKALPFVRRGLTSFEEKLLCQRYYQILTYQEGFQTKAIGHRASVNQLRFKVETPVIMRAAPTVELHTSINTYPHVACRYNGTGVNLDSTFTWGTNLPPYGTHLHLSVDKTSAFSGFGSNELARLGNYGGGQGSLIAFNADY